MATVQQESKPGYKTTEFWMTIVGVLATVANETGLWNWASNWHGGILAAAVIGLYSVSRGIAKQGQPYVETK